MDIVAIGEMLIDFGEVSADDEGYPTLRAQPGGAPANLLVAAARAGCQTAMVGKVGDDVFGHRLKRSLAARGVDGRGIVFDPDVYTTLAFVTLDEAGERTFSFARKPGADTGLRADELPWELLETTRLLHFGSLSLTDEPARTATQTAVEAVAARGGLVSFDPNWRPALWRDPQAARAAMNWGFTHSAIVKLSDEDAAFYWECTPEAALPSVRQLLDESGCELVFLTRGRRGCYVLTPSAELEVAAPVAVTPVDTTGAGDVFTGVALAGVLAHGGDRGPLPEAVLQVIAAEACEAASLSTTQRGGFLSLP